MAREASLDLVEVAPNAKPPVTKLIDYGKFKYNEKIKAREARRNQSTAEIKEIRFRLKIDEHDFEVKKGHVSRFLSGGDKVKVTIMLRGREQSRPIGGVDLLRRLAQEVSDLGTVEFAPKQEGRNIIMTLAPKGKKVHTQSEQRRRGSQSRAERQARQAARLATKQEESGVQPVKNEVPQEIHEQRHAPAHESHETHQHEHRASQSNSHASHDASARRSGSGHSTSTAMRSSAAASSAAQNMHRIASAKTSKNNK
ncbi:infC Bacterial Protein Translation Initiation Factor 3(IF-3) [Bifidobacterium aquikefiri]|uniref:Translation initiation factor IF-3 n=1 Tax=Bifidobacterium aquikefiri TaxID=1653207 RepID=A0A261G0W4_9BIFI|nr:infC Bacterial Protein Translation Initiation Factor 3(IF-3) [Bifidobacterium aquikefiri]